VRYKENSKNSSWAVGVVAVGVVEGGSGSRRNF
jgi:hypothetical protein